MIEEFEEDDGRPVVGAEGIFRLDIGGYEGPIDMLLQLAREQKVDLVNISILELADQYLEFIRAARDLRLELRADYLVMAAWLAYLKSRLLLPQPKEEDEPSGAEMAAALKFQLQRLQAMRDGAEILMARPRLGDAFHARGEGEEIAVVHKSRYEVTLYDLLKAYGRNKSRVEVRSLRIQPMQLYSVEQAIERLRGLVGHMPGWCSLVSFLPSDLQDSLMLRSALATTFAASLEMCREGTVHIRQERRFGPIFLRGSDQQVGEDA